MLSLHMLSTMECSAKHLQYYTPLLSDTVPLVPHPNLLRSTPTSASPYTKPTKHTTTTTTHHNYYDYYAPFPWCPTLPSSTPRPLVLNFPPNQGNIPRPPQCPSTTMSTMPHEHRGAWVVTVTTPT